MHLVVVATPLTATRPERARRLGLQALLFHLSARDVTRVVLEARSPRDSRRDLQLVDALRGARVIPPSQRVEIELPDREPMLWIPDVVAGAVRAAVADETTRWREALGPIEEITVELA